MGRVGRGNLLTAEGDEKDSAQAEASHSDTRNSLQIGISLAIHLSCHWKQGSSQPIKAINILQDVSKIDRILSFLLRPFKKKQQPTIILMKDSRNR